LDCCAARRAALDGLYGVTTLEYLDPATKYNGVLVVLMGEDGGGVCANDVAASIEVLLLALLLLLLLLLFEVGIETDFDGVLLGVVVIFFLLGLDVVGGGGDLDGDMDDVVCFWTAATTTGVAEVGSTATASEAEAGTEDDDGGDDDDDVGVDVFFSSFFTTELCRNNDGTLAALLFAPLIVFADRPKVLFRLLVQVFGFSIIGID
jgi:hypothetical protein